MTEPRDIPDAALSRLSLYHCYLGQLKNSGYSGKPITSRQLAAELDITDETVRRDISFVGDVGTPGSGYDPKVLFSALTGFLGLSEEYPVIQVGTKAVIEAMHVVFPSERFGIKPAVYFSEAPEDVGKTIGGIEIRGLTDITRLDPELGVSVALVSCSPEWAQATVDLLYSAGVMGVLMVTPVIGLKKPEGMNVTQLRMPCDMKSLACRCQDSYGVAETV